MGEVVRRNERLLTAVWCEAGRRDRMFWGTQPTKAFALEQAWVRVLAPALPRLAAGFHFAVAVGSIGKERERA